MGAATSRHIPTSNLGSESTCSLVFSALVDTGLKPGVRQDSEGVLGEQKQKAAPATASSSSVLRLKHPVHHCPYATHGGTQARQTWEMEIQLVLLR